MRWSALARGLCLVLSLACHPAATPGTGSAKETGTPSLTLQHGTLINPGARPIPEANVVVRDGHIACAGTATACPRPAGSKAIDVGGGYVGPGLIDAHVHYSQTGWVDGRPDAIDLRARYPYDSVIHSLELIPSCFIGRTSAAG